RQIKNSFRPQQHPRPCEAAVEGGQAAQSRAPLPAPQPTQGCRNQSGLVRENDPGEAEGGGGRLLPPLPGEWPSAAAAPQPIKSGGDVGTGVQSLAVPCRALRAVPAPWGHALRAPPDHHVHPVVACQHPVKRCEQEVITPRLKMQRCASFLFLSFILCAALSETFGLVLSAKEKRGWTLNSAGYLLGPRRIDQLLLIKEMPMARGREDAPGAYAVDNHRSFSDKHGFTGKREIQPDEDIKAGNLGRPLADENIVRTVIEFLTYLHLKEVGALDNLPSPEETNQS
uniref:Galanin peptides n=1 Tax=Cairina moschata TaxID=8855 RepID=A0A8C3BGQ8_CAIMO